MQFPPIKAFFILLLFILAAYGQQPARVAIINTVDDRDSIGTSDLAFLTNKLRETAVNILPKERYGVMTTESIVAFLGSQEALVRECKASSCLAELGRKVSADYVAQAHIGRFGKQLSINFDIYNVASGNLIGSFADYSKDIFGLLAIINENAPTLFQKMLSAPGGSKAPSASVEGSGSAGVSGGSLVDSRDGKRYKVVKIGTQTWMAENMNHNASGSKCYDNHESNCQKYGRLYDWKTAKTACPKGWICRAMRTGMF